MFLFGNNTNQQSLFEGNYDVQAFDKPEYKHFVKDRVKMNLSRFSCPRIIKSSSQSNIARPVADRSRLSQGSVHHKR